MRIQKVSFSRKLAALEIESGRTSLFETPPNNSVKSYFGV